MSKIELGKKALESWMDGEDVAEEAGHEVMDGANGGGWCNTPGVSHKLSSGFGLK